MAWAKGRYEVFTATDDDDIRAAQRLRWLCFIGARQGWRIRTRWTRTNTTSAATMS